MAKDENNLDSEQDKNGEEDIDLDKKGEDKGEDDSDEGDDDAGDDDKGEGDDKNDYRGKLNATNRFLQKEGYEFKDGKWVKPSANNEDRSKDNQDKKGQDNLSTKDIYALMNNKVHEDDVAKVQKAAKLLNKSIPEALKDPIVLAILKTEADLRKTADATNTGKGRVGSKKRSGADLMAGLSKGEIPAPGSEEAEELFWARRGGRRK